jgi:anaerobic magnesium-protoporphyrin IX monomethyl ester cyclase
MATTLPPAAGFVPTLAEVAMKVLLVNPPYVTLTSRWGVGHQVPLGLLLVGGSLIDAGFDVELLDAESRRLSDEQIARHVKRSNAEIVMTGHAGSTPAHPTCMRMLRTIKRRSPEVVTVYGGVYPTYHALSILRDEPAVDIVVRGEGEATAVDLLQSIGKLSRISAKILQSSDASARLRNVLGIAFRSDGRPALTPERPPIRDLDGHRAAWELIDDWDRYQCFGLGRAAIVQFSRGCPHRCTYCGQHQFWTTWRHRDPAKVADEIAWLHDAHGVRFITLADENPTTSRSLWRQFLEEMAARNRDVHFFATIRASDIVRDADLLDLYRRAGMLYVLLGIDTTDPRTIEAIRKRSNATIDQQACELLRKHGIRSIIGHVVGLGDDTRAGLRRALRILKAYDGDLLNAMYATPHSWTAFARENAERRIVQEDQSKWDYRHQILATEALKPWQLFLAVKGMELAFHLRPRGLWRMLREGDPILRQQLGWTITHIGAVWLAEIFEFLSHTRFARMPKPLREWLEHAAAAHDARDAPANESLVQIAIQRHPMCAPSNILKNVGTSPQQASNTATGAEGQQSHPTDSNRRPVLYESTALPLS